MSRPSFRSNARSSGRLDSFGSENVGSLFKGASESVAALFGDKVGRLGTAPSALGDRTNYHNNNNSGSLSGTMSKPAKPSLASGAPLSARPPLPTGDSTRLSNTGHNDSGRQSLTGDASTRSSTTPRAIEAWTGDEADAGNAQACSEYVQDIFKVLREEENIDQPRPDYMDSQADTNPRMRAVLIDWLVEVHMKYKLRAETLFLAVTILDRFLARKQVSRKKLQLVGVVSTLIAAKYEEIYPPKLSDLVYICDKAYTKDEILEMEIVVLNALEFQLRVPTAVQFLDRFAKVNGSSEQHRHLAQYLAELTLSEIKMIRFTPSHLAAASIYLSNKLLKQPVAWSQIMCNQTGYTEAAIKACAKELCTLLECAQTNSLQAVRKKFSYGKYHSVAKIPF
jgi:cyclin B